MNGEFTDPVWPDGVGESGLAAEASEASVIAEADRLRLFRAMQGMPYAGSIGRPGHPDRVTVDPVVTWLGDLTGTLRRHSDLVAATTQERDTLLRQRTAMRE